MVSGLDPQFALPEKTAGSAADNAAASRILHTGAFDSDTPLLAAIRSAAEGNGDCTFCLLLVFLLLHARLTA